MKRTVVMAVGALVALAACSKKDDGELPAICEDYLTRYACFMKTSTKSGSGVDAIRKGWVTAAAGGGPARAQVEQSCRQQLELQKKDFVEKGCGAP
jgi:hypothetical protein